MSLRRLGAIAVIGAWLAIEAGGAAAFAPPIRGTVEAVKLEDKVVVISIDEGREVMAGRLFDVYRSRRPIAQVQVIKVKDAYAGAKILFTVKGEAVRAGDRAATRD